MKIKLIPIIFVLIVGCNSTEHVKFSSTLYDKKQIAQKLEKECTKFINGTSYFLTEDSSIGLISPADIKLNLLELGYFIEAGAHASLSTNEFRILSPHLDNPIILKANSLIEFHGRNVENPKSIFDREFPVKSEKKLYKIVFALDDMPSEFILVIPSIILDGNEYDPGGYAYKYFENKSGYGLCSPA